MNRQNHTLEYYRRKEQDVFPRIPGMRELMGTDPDSAVNLAAKYPDAVFALMTASEILSGDRERNAIHQDAYSWWSYRFSARAKNVGWRIDYFLVSNRLADKITAAPIYKDVMGSDHCPVGLTPEF